MKGLKPGFFIRLGIIWGKDCAASTSGIFGDKWGCFKPDVIKDMYKRLTSALDSNDPYVPFDALSVLIGSRGATFFCRDRLSFLYRPSESGSSSQDMDVDS
jgi:hypothetical protein